MVTYKYFHNPRFLFEVTPETLEVTPYSFMENGQMWEQRSIYQFFSKISEDEPFNIADVGAQSGLYTLFAKFLPKSTMFSFEPFPASYELLCDNVKLNGIENVRTHNVALSNACGTAVLNTSESHNGLHTMGANPLRFQDVRAHTVETRTLDSFFYDVDRPLHFLKIDTEGWELNVLKGGTKTLRKYRPTIQLEWVPTNMKQCDVDVDELSEFLKSHGYVERSMVDEEKLFEFVE